MGKLVYAPVFYKSCSFFLFNSLFSFAFGFFVFSCSFDFDIRPCILGFCGFSPSAVNKSFIFPICSCAVVYKTCVYVFKVSVMSACPNISLTTFAGTPASNIRVANVCPYGIIGTNQKTPINKGFDEFVLFFFQPFLR